MGAIDRPAAGHRSFPIEKFLEGVEVTVDMTLAERGRRFVSY